jgi:O-antigen/teichoic acid export membrane protein
LTKLRSNVLANFLGQGWTALVQLIALPLYIKLAGIEAFGLIAFYVTLQITTQAFDLGLGQTLNRELARSGAVPGQAREMRDIVRTVESVYLVLLPVMACLLLLIAPVLATDVVKSRALGQDAVREAIQLMALLIPLQWAAGLYHGALMGLERQRMANLLRAVFVTLGALGAVVVLATVSPSILAFFLWQILITIAYLVTLGVVLYRGFPPAVAGGARFRTNILGRIWRFAAGMAGISVAGVIFTQLDRWVLVSLSSLETFGYYSVAAAVAGALYFVITPLFSAVFPRFSALAASGRREELHALYALGTQAMVGIVLPLGLIVALFAQDIILVWTGNPGVAAQAAPIAGILALGTVINGVMNLPYAMQLAFGWVRLALMLVTALIVAFLPALIALVMHFGPIGAAFAWLGLNAAYFLIGAPLTHRRLMPGRGMQWLTGSVLPGFFAGAAVVVGGWMISPGRLDGAPGMLFLLVLAALAVLAACMAGAESRKWLRARLARA